MANPHLTAVRAAQRTDKGLAQLFAQLGTTEHPRGALLVAYRNARRALATILRRGGPAAQWEAREVLTALRREVEAIARDALRRAESLGEKQARAILQTNGLEGAPLTPGHENALAAWLALFDAQSTSVQALVVGGAAPAEIVGDDVRVGVLQPGPLVQEGARWLAQTAVGPLQRTMDFGAGARFEWHKQVIATIDERVTDCCLQAHGQTVPREEMFTLAGTPRFADKQDWVPFHWYCRSSVALVRAQDVDDGLTARLTAASKAELQARAEAQAHVDELRRKLADLGQQPDIRIRKEDPDEVKRLRERLRMWKARVREKIHPASATSRR